MGNAESEDVPSFLLPSKKLSGSAKRKGFWFAHTCACSLNLFYKTLLIFPQSK